ncbi:MAG: glycosyltransferase family 39 protein [Actinobacteria bacterium]|nr:glycosyltransferase family 39 protein [Actinomycetota bacterium]
MRSRTFADRLLNTIPLVGLGLLVLSFYFVEAWTRKTPWLFTDEIEWTQISRAIAATGHAARRGQPVAFKSLYAFLIAPFWWIHSTHAAYTAIKFANAVMMSLAAIPTYFLGRMLVSRRGALVAAVLSVAIPGMSYAQTIIPESLAYTWFALTAWLSVRALATRRRRDVVLAVVVSLVAVRVRLELEVVLGALAIAAGGLWVTGPRGRRMRQSWTRGDTIGAVVLFVGALFLFNRVILQRSYEWHQATEYWKSRMVDLGLNAGSALAIGLGLIPVVAGFVALRLPERRGQPVYRAFAAYLATSLLVFSFYTAGKAAYVSTVFATLVEERNLIYLSPLLLVATVLVFESRRVDWRVVAAAAAFVLFIVLTKPFQLSYPYFEAPGYSILAVLTRHFSWTIFDLHALLVLALAVGLLALAFRDQRVVRTAGVALLLCWLLTGEIGAAAGDSSESRFFRSYLPPVWNGIDLMTHGQGVTFLGNQLKDPNGILLAEFWNRSLHHMASFDNTAPGPGPTIGPSLVDVDGTLSYWTGDHYVLAGPGIVMQGRVVGDWGGLQLYRIKGPWKLRQEVEGVYADGWGGAVSSFTYYERGGPGTLLVDLRRTPSSAPPGNVTIHVGTVRLNSHGNPAIGHLEVSRKTVIDDGGEVKVRIHVAHTPLRALIQVTPTFQPSSTDTRQLGAQESFTFCPAAQPAPCE